MRGQICFPPLAKVFGVIWASDEVNNIIIDKDFYFKKANKIASGSIDECL